MQPNQGPYFQPPVDPRGYGTPYVQPVPSRAKPWLVVTLLLTVVVLLAAAATAVVFVVKYRDERSKIAAADNQRSQVGTTDVVRQTACDDAKVLGTYDFEHFDDYARKVHDAATGDFRNEFDKTTADLRTTIVGSQVRSTVVDAECGIASVDSDHAKAVVSLTTSTTSRTTPQPTSKNLPLVMQLDRSGGRWLMSKVDSPSL